MSLYILKYLLALKVIARTNKSLDVVLILFIWTELYIELLASRKYKLETLVEKGVSYGSFYRSFHKIYLSRKIFN
jgi:hypothetical protein